MSLVEIGQYVLIVITVLIGLGATIKVIFFDNSKK